jgi:hypothetical protein
MLMSAIGIFFGESNFIKDIDFLDSFYTSIGDWNFWLFIVTITVVIACGWIFGDLMLKLSKFKRLINTTSKATFVRNQEEIEELAWKIGPKYMEIVNERKQKFRIRN